MGDPERHPRYDDYTCGRPDCEGYLCVHCFNLRHPSDRPSYRDFQGAPTPSASYNTGEYAEGLGDTTALVATTPQVWAAHSQTVSRRPGGELLNPALLGHALPTASELDRYLDRVNSNDIAKAARAKATNDELAANNKTYGEQLAANNKVDGEFRRESDRLHHERLFRNLRLYSWEIAAIVVVVVVVVAVVLQKLGVL